MESCHLREPAARSTFDLLEMIAAGSTGAFGAMSEFRGDEGRLMEKRHAAV